MSDDEQQDVVVIEDLATPAPVNDLPESSSPTRTINEQHASTSERKPMRRGKLIKPVPAQNNEAGGGSKPMPLRRRRVSKRKSESDDETSNQIPEVDQTMDGKTKGRAEKLVADKPNKETVSKEAVKRKATKKPKIEVEVPNAAEPLESTEATVSKKLKPTSARNKKTQNGTTEEPAVEPVAVKTAAAKKARGTKAESPPVEESVQPEGSPQKRARVTKVPPPAEEPKPEEAAAPKRGRAKKPKDAEESAAVAEAVATNSRPKRGVKKTYVESEPEPKSPKKSAEPAKRSAKAPATVGTATTATAAKQKEVVTPKKKGRAKKVETTNGNVGEIPPPADSVDVEPAVVTSPVPAQVKKGRGKKPATSDKSMNLIKKIVEDMKSTIARSRKKKKLVDEEEVDNTIDEQESVADSAGPSKSKKKKTEKKPTVNNSATDYSNMDFSLPDKEWNFKISSWNTAGLRAWITKGGLEYIAQENPDIICLQETKCTVDQLPEETKIKGYHPYWLCQPGGYAGVAIYSKIMPMSVTYGLNDLRHDDEGRLMTAEYEKFYLICTYVPNAGRKLVTLPKRMDWDIKFQNYVKRLDSKKPVIICGDMNVAHSEIDLANPKTNKRNAGFTQEERDGMTDLLKLGFVDTYRHLYPKIEKAYTFWTYMMNARAKNVGWRIDYFLVSERLLGKIVDNVIRSKILGSDHCPITLFLNNIIK